MTETIDARGLACPRPVMLTAKALEVADRVTTVVDNQVAVENVSRLARAKGFEATVEPAADGIRLHLVRKGAAAEGPSSVPGAGSEPAMVACATGPVVLFVASDAIGTGSDELGHRLMAAFFHTLPETAPLPDRLVLMNAGVKLAVGGALTLEDLRLLAGSGVEILACGTCLGYYDLTERLAVGRVSNMYEIAETLMQAGRVVAL